MGFVDNIDADYLRHGIERQGRRQSFSNDGHEHIGYTGQYLIIQTVLNIRSRVELIIQLCFQSQQ